MKPTMDAFFAIFNAPSRFSFLFRSPSTAPMRDLPMRVLLWGMLLGLTLGLVDSRPTQASPSAQTFNTCGTDTLTVRKIHYQTKELQEIISLDLNEEDPNPGCTWLSRGHLVDFSVSNWNVFTEQVEPYWTFYTITDNGGHITTTEWGRAGPITKIPQHCGHFQMFFDEFITIMGEFPNDFLPPIFELNSDNIEYTNGRYLLKVNLQFPFYDECKWMLYREIEVHFESNIGEIEPLVIPKSELSTDNARDGTPLVATAKEPLTLDITQHILDGNGLTPELWLDVRVEAHNPVEAETNTSNNRTRKSIIVDARPVLQEVNSTHFLENSYFMQTEEQVDNPIDVKADWNGDLPDDEEYPLGTVVFALNDSEMRINAQNHVDLLTHTYQLSNDFIVSKACNNNRLRIWLEIPHGETVWKSSPYQVQTTVFPTADWILAYIAKGADLPVPSSGGGSLTYRFSFKDPATPVTAGFKVPFDKEIPFFSDFEVGMQDIQAVYEAEISSSGIGKANGEISGGWIAKSGIPRIGRQVGQGSSQGTEARIEKVCGQGYVITRLETFARGEGTVAYDLPVKVKNLAPKLMERVEAIPFLKQYGKHIADLSVQSGLEAFAEHRHIMEGQGGALVEIKNQTTIGLGATFGASISLLAVEYEYFGGTRLLSIWDPPFDPENLTELGVELFVNNSLRVGPFTPVGTFAGTVWNDRRTVRCTYPSGCNVTVNAASTQEDALTASVAYESAWELLPRTYASEGYAAFAASEIQASLTTGATTLIQNGYPYPEPTLAVRDGALRWVSYVHDDTTKAQGRGTEIYLVAGNGDSWQAPQALTNDQQPDFAPQAAFGTQGGVVAWERVTLPTSAAMELNDAYWQSMEIATRTWNGSAWSSVTLLTDNQLADHGLQLAPAQDGSVLALWRTHDGVELIATPEHPLTLSYAIWDGSAWQPAKTALSGLTHVLNVAVAAQSRNQAALVFVRDTDGYLESELDRELFYSTFDGKNWSAPQPITADWTADEMPLLAYDSQGIRHLLWSRNDDLFWLRNSWKMADGQVVWAGVEAKQNLSLTSGAEGALALIWQQQDENGPNLAYSLWDAESAAWLAPVALTNDVALEKQPQVALGEGGQLLTAYAQTTILTATIQAILDGDVDPAQVSATGQTNLIFHTYIPPQTEPPNPPRGWSAVAPSPVGSEIDPGAVALDAQQNLWVAGSFVHPPFESTSDRGIFLAKYDAAGQLLWANNTGSVPYHNAPVAGGGVDGSGNFYFGGDYGAEIVIGGFTVTNTAPVGDVFVAKYGPDGTPIWAKSLNRGNRGQLYLADLAVDGAGNVYLTGTWYDSVNFDGTLLPELEEGVFVAKFNSDGILQWVRHASGNDPHERSGHPMHSAALAVDSAGNVVVIGEFAGTVHFGEQEVATDSGAHLFIVKYSANGNLLWAQQLGSRGYFDEAIDLAIGPQNSLRIIGSFGELTDIASTVLQGGFLAQYSPEGTLEWVKGLGLDSTAKVAVDASGRIFIASHSGSAELPVDGNSTPWLWVYNARGEAEWVLGAGDNLSNPQLAVGAGGEVALLSGLAGTAAVPVGPFTLQGSENRNLAIIYLVDALGVGTLQFTEPLYTAYDDWWEVEIPVVRLGGQAGAVTIPYWTQGGSAVPGVDFVEASGELEFANGEITRTIRIDLHHDALVEGAEYFSVRLGTPTGGAALGAQTTTLIRLLDDSTDSLPNAIASEQSLEFLYDRNSNPTDSAHLSLLGSISPFDWFAYVTEPWITLSAYSGTNEDNGVTVTVDPGDLAPGDYTGKIWMHTERGAGIPQATTVTLRVTGEDTPSDNTILLSTTQIDLAGFLHGSNPTEQLVLTNALEQAVAWTATTTEPWLLLSEPSGVTPAILDVTVAIAQLGVGTHLAQIHITNAEELQVVSVKVTVARQEKDPISLSTPQLSFFVDKSAPTPALLSLTADNPVPWTATSSVLWLILSVDSGVTPATIEVTVAQDQLSHLGAGEHTGQIHIFTEGYSEPQLVTVKVMVGSGTVDEEGASIYLPYIRSR